MIKIKETKTKTISVKNVYMNGENLMLDENGEAVDFYKILRDTYGDGTDFEIKVTVKVDAESW